MRLFGLLLLSVSALVPLHNAATADVLMHPPEPDLRLSLPVSASELRDLRALLLRFAAIEKLTPFEHVPRASGKLFFLGMRRADSVVIIAEKSSTKSPITVECRNIEQSAPGFQLEDKLLRSLRKRWPDLQIEYTHNRRL